MVIKRSDFTGRFHRIVEVGDMVYLAGVTARNAGEDAGAQTTDILTQIDDLLAKAGAAKRDIITANIWLADIGDFAAMNLAWDAWLDREHAPRARNHGMTIIVGPASLKRFRMELMPMMSTTKKSFHVELNRGSAKNMPGSSVQNAHPVSQVVQQSIIRRTHRRHLVYARPKFPKVI